MTRDCFDRSRRRVMRAVVTGIPAAVLLWSSRTEASDKMTQKQAEYRDTPDGIYSCGMCTLFVKPNACKVVEGEISRDGWCKAFALLD
ncbi:MAG: high potential iron sulfur protein [Rhizobiales bacterium]|nr:high potential iron sulfur protein [Hyphomicrobiales bacterium]